MRFEDLSGQVFGKLTVLRRGKSRYFHCKCECGNETEVYASSLKKGLTTSCGCYRKEFRRNGYDPGINDLYSIYKRDAGKKEREFSLTKEEFSEIITAPCTYCGAPPNRKHRPNRIGTTLLFNGVDRKDNSKGYVTGNAQPCCSICNQAKHTLPEEVFLSWVERVHNHLKEK